MANGGGGAGIGGGGGGFSGVFSGNSKNPTHGNAMVIAGGGGGGSSTQAGGGGGKNGQNSKDAGYGTHGLGGSSTSGGAPPTSGHSSYPAKPGNTGSALAGADGARWCGCGYCWGSGAGGGGLYGGGSGGFICCGHGGGGGGGSGYVSGADTKLIEGNHVTVANADDEDHDGQVRNRNLFLFFLRNTCIISTSVRLQ